jgi:release factor glutamine methyltransferase
MAKNGTNRQAASLRQIVARVGDRLAAAGIGSARAEAWLLLGRVSGRERPQLIADSLESLTPAQEAELERLVQRRLAREPIAYILGEKEFWSLPFQVGPAVLIPRPESETVVEAALAALPERRAALHILDLGTGSGCLLLALLSELPNATGLGVDASAAALEIAEANAHRLGLAGRAEFEQRTWATGLDCPFDLIVSNPPYVSEADRAELQPEIRDFEPHAALFAGPDGMEAYRALAPDCARLLRPAGFLALEIGQGQGEPVARILEQHGLIVAARSRDLAGIERCLIARRDASGRRDR